MTSIYRRITKKSFVKTVGIPVYALLITAIFLLAVGQDFIYSKVRYTGFYLPESMLYNAYYLFFIPLTGFTSILYKRITIRKKWLQIMTCLVLGLLISVIHLLLSTVLFVSISNLFFTPPHRFSVMLKAYIANHFYLVLLWYIGYFFITKSNEKSVSEKANYPNQLVIKSGVKTVTVPINTIRLITTDKPYSVVHTHSQKLLDNRSLKAFEGLLDPTVFRRVHRSYILHSDKVIEFKSRSNGDYDAALDNGQTVRLSRHYRTNWSDLLG